VSRRFSRKPFEIGKPELDERADPLLDPSLAREGECLLVARAHLLGIDALLQAVVAGHEQLLDPLARVFPLHKSTVTSQG
jgi:hypothetical protein